MQNGSSAKSRPNLTPCFSCQAPIKSVAASTRTVTTLQETIFAQVPDKQASLGKLKKEHGDVV
jgi:hypothetical protein